MGRKSEIENRELFTRRLNQRYKKIGLSEAKIADLIKEKTQDPYSSANQSTISSYLNGHKAPGKEILKALAEILKTTPEYLKGETDMENQQQLIDSYSRFLSNNIVPFVETFLTMSGVYTITTNKPQSCKDKEITYIAIAVFEKWYGERNGLCCSEKSYWKKVCDKDFFVATAKTNPKMKKELFVSIVNGDVLIERIYSSYRTFALSAHDMNFWLIRNADHIDEELQRVNNESTAQEKGGST